MAANWRAREIRKGPQKVCACLRNLAIRKTGWFLVSSGVAESAVSLTDHVWQGILHQLSIQQAPGSVDLEDVKSFQFKVNLRPLPATF